MTISRVNWQGWSLGDKFTHAQANALDVNVASMLDGADGHADALGSTVACFGAGRLIPSISAGWDADTTVSADGGNTVIYATNTLTTSRIYTLDATRALPGDRISVVNASASLILVRDQASAPLLQIGLSGDCASADFVFTLADGWVVKSPRKGDPGTQTFLASGTYTGPLGCSVGLVIGCGAGGGGASGHYDSTPSSTLTSPGGGGGGGALLHVGVVLLTPGGSYSVVLGPGGAGGLGGSNHNPGGDGGDTIFDAQTVFTGAQGGQDGQSGVATSADPVAYGGSCVRGATRGLSPYFTASGLNGVTPSLSGSVGGCGYYSSNAVGSIGNGSAAPVSLGSGFGSTPLAGGNGGNGGAIGSNGSNCRGGGPGGGGGGGPYGNGGSGGNGGNGGGPTGSNASSTGAGAAANSGAGGGGGGAGGKGTASNGFATQGGNCGSGRLTIIPLR